MKVCHTLICFFFLSLQDGNTGLGNAQIIPVISGTEGEDITFKCPFSFFERTKFFCKEECKQEDILIETTRDRAQRGRYSINYKRGSQSGRTLSVSISQLTKSDSGLYGCGLGLTYVPFEIIVVDAQLDGDPSEETTLYTRPGGNITVECSFTVSGSTKYFCKEQCKEKDILVETTGDRAQRDRYNIRYTEGSSTGTSLYVSITQLTKSDSGRYRCGLYRRFFQDPYRGFEIIVSDDPTSAPVPSASAPPTTQSLNSTLSSASPETIQQTETATPTATTDVLLYVGLTLIAMVALLLLALLIFRTKRPSKPEEPPVETEYASVTEINQVYEDSREDRQSRSPPVEMSSVYTLTTYTKPSGVETNDEYSSVTAASPQNTAEDDLSKLTYSELNFSNRTAGSRNSALRGDGDNVIYSVPRVEASSDASRAEDDPPVYATVT